MPSVPVAEAKKRVARARALLAEAKKKEKLAERGNSGLDEARATVADAEAELQDAEAAMENVEHDLIDESRLDDNLEQVIAALEARAGDDLRLRALKDAAQALAALRATPRDAPIDACAARVEEALRRCVGHLLDLGATAPLPKPQARASARLGEDAALRLPDDLSLAVGTPSARRQDRFPIRRLGVVFRGRRGELYGTLYLSRG